MRLILVAVLWVVSVNAAALPIVSGDGNETCTGTGGGCNVMTIDRHPAWQTNNPGASDAQWISFADTGWNGLTEVQSSTSSPGATFFEELTFTSATTLSMRVWGDDTVQVFLNDVAQNLLDFTMDAACTGGSIGCEPNEFGEFNWLLDAGVYLLRFDVYQLGGGPFGLLYAGEFDSASEFNSAREPNPVNVPEPGSAVLVVSALGLLAAHKKTRRRLIASGE
jgi:hypothetical protein